MTRCRILLTPLNELELAGGYSAQGLAYLTGSSTANPHLAFTRQQFVQELPGEQQGMSISGYQPKLQMVLNNNAFSVVAYQGNDLLKPSPADFPWLAENEHATMTLMTRLGFDVPPQGLVSFAPEQSEEKEYAFAIRRFDRDAEGRPVHQEQLDGAMAIAEKYGKTSDDGEQYISYESIARFLIVHVNNNLAFRIDFFRRIIYAWLLGNNDLHLRNFGLVYLNRSLPQLAPVYDFVSVAPYRNVFNSCYLALPLLACEEGGKELAPGFDTDWGEYTGQDFSLLGEAMGLTPKLIAKLFDDLRKEAFVVEQTYQQSFMPPEHIEMVLGCYRHRLRLLEYQG